MTEPSSGPPAEAAAEIGATLRDSRRLTGPNVIMAGPGAVIDLELAPRMDAAGAEAIIAAWRVQARDLLDALGWQDEILAHRLAPGGVSLALSASLDVLYAATEINEAAWEAVAAARAGRPLPSREAVLTRLRAEVEGERKPRLRALEAAASDHGVSFLADDEHVSVGLGRGARTWPTAALPTPEEVDWSAVHEVPVVLVTGTNGKSTSVRLLAAMVAAAGRVPGVSSTDWIRVGDELLDQGDYSGPGGARAVLRDERTEVAILETARGGLLRRGLAVTSADVALVTNIAEDHLGEFGVHDLEALADTKLVVARAAACLVLNLDDALLRQRAAFLGRPVVWFSLQGDDDQLRAHVKAGGGAATVEEGDVVLYHQGARTVLAAIGEIPFTLSGAARHNVSNALAAAATGSQLELPPAALGAGLRTFASSPQENPGRLNTFMFGDLRVVVDFAHNPHGLQALFAMAAALPARRRLVTLGQAGDRDDEAIRDLARIAWSIRPEHVVLKEMAAHRRGRAPGEVPALLEAELRHHGAPSQAIEHAPSELAAARQALAWARPGDLLLLLSHAERDAVLSLLSDLAARGWRPGQVLPVTDEPD